MNTVRNLELVASKFVATVAATTKWQKKEPRFDALWTIKHQNIGGFFLLDQHFISGYKRHLGGI